MKDLIKLNIRNYTPNDLHTLIDLFRSSVRTIACKDYSKRQIFVWAPDHIDPKVFGDMRMAKPTWVAEVDNQIAGFIDLEPGGHIDMLYVHPDHQSKGVASALFQHVEKIATQQGCAKLYTESSITARPVFERVGFKVVAEQTVTKFGEEFTNYRMTKLLTGIT